MRGGSGASVRQRLDDLLLEPGQPVVEREARRVGVGGSSGPYVSSVTSSCVPSTRRRLSSAPSQARSSSSLSCSANAVRSSSASARSLPRRARSRRGSRTPRSPRRRRRTRAGTAGRATRPPRRSPHAAARGCAARTSRSDRGRRTRNVPSRRRSIPRSTVSPAASSPRARGRGGGRRRAPPFARPGRDDGLPIVVHLQHELRRLRLRVAEELLEHERDVRHEVDRVVPDDHDPRPVLVTGLLLVDLLDVRRRLDDLRAHRLIVAARARPRAVTPNAARPTARCRRRRPRAPTRAA